MNICRFLRRPPLCLCLCICVTQLMMPQQFRAASRLSRATPCNADAAKDETLFCPICRAWHDLTGRWGVDWYQSPGRQTGDGGGLEENWDVDLGSIYSPPPPSLPGFHLSHLDYCSCHSRAHMVRVRSQYVWRLTLNGWCTRRRHKGLQ